MSQISDRDRRLRAVFDEALLLEPSAREAYLDHACAGDPELRSAVLPLLPAQQETRSFLAQPADEPMSAWHVAGTGSFLVLRGFRACVMGILYEVPRQSARRGRRAEDLLRAAPRTSIV